MSEANTYELQRPTLAIISGRPGSGKSTLARTLATALPCPLISRDEINAGIHRTISRPRDVSGQDDVALRTFGTFFRAIELLLASGATVIAEAAFQDHRWRTGLESLLPVANVRIVQCLVSPELARQRVVRRRLQQHDLRPPTARPFQPLSLAVPSLDVRTADGYDPGVDKIIEFIDAPLS